jgi:hypothetical protein
LTSSEAEAGGLPRVLQSTEVRESVSQAGLGVVRGVSEVFTGVAIASKRLSSELGESTAWNEGLRDLTRNALTLLRVAGASLERSLKKISDNQ